MTSKIELKTFETLQSISDPVFLQTSMQTGEDAL